MSVPQVSTLEEVVNITNFEAIFFFLIEQAAFRRS